MDYIQYWAISTIILMFALGAIKMIIDKIISRRVTNAYIKEILKRELL